jgi:hypothetical protein
MPKNAKPIAVPPELVARLAHELALHRELANSLPEPKKRRKAITDILKQIDRLVTACRVQHSPYRIAPATVVVPLVEILSGKGFERVLGIRLVDMHICADAVRMERHDERCGPPLSVQDRRQHEQALSAALDHPLHFIIGLIDEIRKPLLASLALCATTTGRPRDVERRHVVLEAKKAFEQITGRRASKNPSGAFVQFCSDLCDALGMSETDTLCSFVPEVLYRQKRRRSKTRTTTSRVANPSD